MSLSPWAWPRRARRFQRLILLVWIALILPHPLLAAFEGFGASTPGGDRGAVIEVTSLDDAGPGTLREVLSQANNSRIVFKVGGILTLQSALAVRGRSFITIDGSTAPAPGITLAGNGLAIRNSHDIIVTHLRVRNPVSDGIMVWDGSYNVVIDHCSLTDAGDENLSITEAAAHVTVSWCIIGDTRPDSFVRKTKGMLIAHFDKPAVTNVSLHHNLFINEFERSPQISTEGLFDIRNNVIQDWGYYGIRIRNRAWGNIINNVFAAKHASTKSMPKATIRVLARSATSDKAIILVSDGLFAAGPVYIQGNQGTGDEHVNTLRTATAAFPVAPVSTDPVEEVSEKVLRGAGAFPRDEIDALLLRGGSLP